MDARIRDKIRRGEVSVVDLARAGMLSPSYTVTKMSWDVDKRAKKILPLAWQHTSVQFSLEYMTDSSLSRWSNYYIRGDSQILYREHLDNCWRCAADTNIVDRARRILDGTYRDHNLED